MTEEKKKVLVDYTNEPLFLELIQNGHYTFNDKGQIFNSRGQEIGIYKGSGKKHKQYPIICYLKDNIRYHIVAHRLVYLYYHGPIPKGRWVGFKDNDRSNRSKDNLILLTKEMIKEKNITNGNKSTKGEDKINAKLKDKEVLEYRAIFNEGNYVSLTAIAKPRNVSYQTIYYAVVGLTFKHLPNAVPIEKYKAICESYKAEEYKNKEGYREKKRLAKAARDKEYMKKKREAEKLNKSFTVKPKIEKPIVSKSEKVKVKKETVEKPVPVTVPVPVVLKSESKATSKPIPVYKPVADSPKDKPALKSKRKFAVKSYLRPTSSNLIEEEKKDDFHKKRIELIRQAVKNREQEKPSGLSMFKKFAVYHLKKLGYNIQRIIEITKMSQEDIDEAIRVFPVNRYDEIRSELIEKHGRDSGLLQQIKMFEGEFL